MISRIVVELKTLSKEKIDYNIGSALQGVLMNIIDTQYAQRLHEQSLNPYSQYFFKNKNKLYWVISTFTKEARDYIIKPFLEDKVDDFFIKYKSEKFTPDEKLIINSIYNKINKFSNFELDNEVVLSLIEHIKIVDYNLKSTRFNLEGLRIPSFVGNIKISTNKCSNKEKEYANLILNFAPYCGIGIKTSIGMGGVRVDG